MEEKLKRLEEYLYKIPLVLTPSDFTENFLKNLKLEKEKYLPKIVLIILGGVLSISSIFLIRKFLKKKDSQSPVSFTQWA